ncbi:hypothetical protein AB0H77_42130 [Streptomyces sp. NPDC050844]|uniref:hypothetical protein n=1 Tax=Streptomyces sp. NPDC050844 TaxID=3155790 RepID=UPI0033DE6147
MASLSDGTYHISVDDQMFITRRERFDLALASESSETAKLEVRRTESGTYTITLDSTPLHLSFVGEPEVFKRVVLGPEPREWNISAGPGEGTFTIAAIGSSERLTLGIHPALINPPMIGLSPDFGEDRGWNFHEAK